MDELARETSRLRVRGGGRGGEQKSKEECNHAHREPMNLALSDFNSLAAVPH